MLSIEKPLKSKSNAKSFAISVTVTAVAAASLTSLKLALSFVPNVELVTVLILVYATVLGRGKTVTATIIFCFVEMLIYGVGSWVVLYFVYFPTLALTASVALKNKKLWVAVMLATLGSLLFGFLSACGDTLFMVTGLSSADLAKYFVAYYVRGLYFDLIHTVSNFIVVFLLYKPLVLSLNRVIKKSVA